MAARTPREHALPIAEQILMDLEEEAQHIEAENEMRGGQTFEEHHGPLDPNVEEPEEAIRTRETQRLIDQQFLIHGDQENADPTDDELDELAPLPRTRYADGGPVRRGSLLEQINAELGGEAPIDQSRPIVENDDGSFSTESTIGIEADGKHYNIPTIVGGKRVSHDEAVKLWREGKNKEVGTFGSQAEADAAAPQRSARAGVERSVDRVQGDIEGQRGAIRGRPAPRTGNRPAPRTGGEAQPAASLVDQIAVDLQAGQPPAGAISTERPDANFDTRDYRAREADALADPSHGQSNMPGDELPADAVSGKRAPWLGEGGVLTNAPAGMVAAAKNAMAGIQSMIAGESAEQREEALGVQTDLVGHGESPTFRKGAQRAQQRHREALEAAKKAGEEAQLWAKQTKRELELVTPEHMDTFQQGVWSIVQSSPPTLTGIGVGIVSRNPWLAMAIAGGGGGAQQAGHTYLQAKGHGASHRTAGAAAGIDMLLEGGGEALPLSIALKAGSPFLARLAGTMGAEAGQEAVTQLAQDLNAYLVYNPDITLGEAWQNLKVATIAGALGGAVYGTLGHLAAGKPEERPAITEDQARSIREQVTAIMGGPVMQPLASAVRPKVESAKLTHRLEDGTPVRPKVEDGKPVAGVWEDARGTLFEAKRADPIQTEPNATWKVGGVDYEVEVTGPGRRAGSARLADGQEVSIASLELEDEAKIALGLIDDPEAAPAKAPSGAISTQRRPKKKDAISVKADEFKGQSGGAPAAKVTPKPAQEAPSTAKPAKKPAQNNGPAAAPGGETEPPPPRGSRAGDGLAGPPVAVRLEGKDAEAAAAWARKNSVGKKPVEPAGPPSENDVLSNKRAAFKAHTEAGDPDDVAGSRVQRAQAMADEKGERVILQRSKTGALSTVTASSSVRGGEVVATFYPQPKLEGVRSLQRQNRLREGVASVAQMNQIANKPDYDRLSVSKAPETGAPMASVAGDEELPAEQLGKSGIVVIGGERVPVRYAVIEAAQLLASHSADGRQRAEYFADPKKGDIRALNNGRAAGLREAYMRDTARDYRAALLADPDHGVSAQVIEKLERPVLVRIYPDAFNTKIVNIGEASQGETLEQSPLEIALQDAAKLASLEGFQPGENGDVGAASNDDFVRRFLQTIVPENQRGRLFDPTTRKPNKLAYDRIEAAIFQKAYGSKDLTGMFAEAAEPEIRAVLNALAIAAPEMAQLEGAPDLVDIRPFIAAAAKLVLQAKRQGAKLETYLKQQDIEGRHPLVQEIAEFMAQNIRSPRKMGEGFKAGAKFVQFAVQDAATGDIFGDKPQLTVSDALKAINKFVEVEYGEAAAREIAQGNKGQAAEERARYTVGSEAPAQPDERRGGRPAAQAEDAEGEAQAAVRQGGGPQVVEQPAASYAAEGRWVGEPIRGVIAWDFPERSGQRQAAWGRVNERIVVHITRPEANVYNLEIEGWAWADGAKFKRFSGGNGRERARIAAQQIIKPDVTVRRIEQPKADMEASKGFEAKPMFTAKWVTPELKERALRIAAGLEERNDTYMAQGVRNLLKTEFAGMDAEKSRTNAAKHLDAYQEELNKLKPVAEVMADLAARFDKLGMKKNADGIRARDSIDGKEAARLRMALDGLEKPLPRMIYQRVVSTGQHKAFTDRAHALGVVADYRKRFGAGRFEIVNVGGGVAIRVMSWPGGITESTEGTFELEAAPAGDKPVPPTIGPEEQAAAIRDRNDVILTPPPGTATTARPDVPTTQSGLFGADELPIPPSRPKGRSGGGNPGQGSLFQPGGRYDVDPMGALEQAFGSDEALGVDFTDEDLSRFPDGRSATNCTACAAQVVRALGPRAQIWGFSETDNPTSKIVIDAGTGHDFAIVDGKYLVDPWIKLVAAYSDRAVFDLQADAALIEEWYGPRANWSRLEEAERQAGYNYDRAGNRVEDGPGGEYIVGDLAAVEVEVEVTIAETGAREKVKMPADAALKEIDDNLVLARRLHECLHS